MPENGTVGRVTATGEGDMLVGVVADCTFPMNGLRFVTRVKAPRRHTS
ncbi:hypothetical protein [Streptomyces sp. NPDC057280]